MLCNRAGYYLLLTIYYLLGLLTQPRMSYIITLYLFLTMNGLLYNILGILGAIVLLCICDWLLSKPVDLLIRCVKRLLRNYPTWIVVLETILGYVPYFLSLLIVGYVCYKVHIYFD